MVTNPLVGLRNVSHRVQDRFLLQNVSWEILSGQRWAILGPNGSSKSTLLKVAAGYLRPNAGGEVCWQGSPYVNLRELRQRIGWVAQHVLEAIPVDEPALHTVVSGRFAQFGLTAFPGFMATPSDLADGERQLAVLGMDHLAGAPFGRLSQGEKQLVLIARACMAEPWLVVLDEPCAGLDPGARERFLSSLSDLLRAHPPLSAALVTHHVEEIVPEFEQLLALQDGQVIACGELRSQLTASLLAELYQMAECDVQQRHGRYWPMFRSPRAD